MDLDSFNRLQAKNPKSDGKVNQAMVAIETLERYNNFVSPMKALSISKANCIRTQTSLIQLVHPLFQHSFKLLEIKRLA